MPRLVLSQDIDHWETIVQKTSICRYVVPSAPVDQAWMTSTFDDSSWNSGPGGVGYGDDDDPTSIDPALSVYCRYLFDVPDPEVISALMLDIDFDDGFVAYLNGTELARYNMGEAGSITYWNQSADDLYEARLYQGASPYRVVIDNSLIETILNKNNVLAIEVHNQN